MEADQMDALLKSLTQVFVLSLGVERVSTVLKRMNFGFGFRVDDVHLLDTQPEGRAKGDADSEAAKLTKDQKDEVRRAVNSVNTFFVGALLAFITGANAFQGLVDLPDQALWPKLHWVVWASQVTMTGAAAGVGSSFWYDMISLVIEARRTRRSLANAGRATAEELSQAHALGRAGFTDFVDEGEEEQPEAPKGGAPA